MSAGSADPLVAEGLIADKESSLFYSGNLSSLPLDGGMLTQVKGGLFSSTLHETFGSRPNGFTLSDPALLKNFRAGVNNEFQFARLLFKQGSKQASVELRDVQKMHKKGDISSSATAVQMGVSSWASGQSDEGFWLPFIRKNPANAAASEFDEAGLSDVQVPSTFQPDGGGVHRQFLDRLSRKMSSTDRRRGLGLQRFLDKIQKQGAELGESVDTTSIVRARPENMGSVLQVVPTISADRRYVTLEVAVATRVDSGSTSLSGDFVGHVPGGLAGSDPTVTQIGGGGTTLIGGLVQSNEVLTGNIPLLGDLPVVGWLFKNKSLELERTSLIILVTPRVLKE
jgi:hypothetical protein